MMTDPKETNEDINEELSTDELKEVSGGIFHGTDTWDHTRGFKPNKKDNNSDVLHRGRSGSC